jgi:hypothetical protein
MKHCRRACAGSGLSLAYSAGLLLASHAPVSLAALLAHSGRLYRSLSRPASLTRILLPTFSSHCCILPPSLVCCWYCHSQARRCKSPSRIKLGDSPANLLINEGGYGHTTRAPPGVSLPSGSRTRNLQILDPVFKPLRCSGDSCVTRLHRVQTT